ncbi:chemotaxis protein CheA [Teredinibacter turnerae]|uniref:chemotaxis protein CheA n=1 Tax=Teredinibacter turnerae TaxID=2426 RepID=UPI000366952E|nr:chemotaxis protein CheA [Teredinibacter turnerae]
MTIDLAQFHQVFYEESFEGLDVMESALMELDPDNIDSETINAIFRAAHSIKGGSATFGFTSVSEFTHDLETILDQVRAGTRKFSGDDVNLCLKSVDCMREMLQLLQGGDDGHTPLSMELKHQFARMLSSDSDVTDSQECAPEQAPEQDPQGPILWEIRFTPGSDILKTGNDVLRMLRDMGDLGELLSVSCTPNLPAFNAFDAESCYLSWRILLESDCEKSAIQEIFEWVIDESELGINETEGLSHWKILFKPGATILHTGNEPLRLFNSLAELGELTATAFVDKLPRLSLFDCENCFMSWELSLVSSSATKESIEAVFEWVVDDAELVIAQESNSKPKPVADRVTKDVLQEQKAPQAQTPPTNVAAASPPEIPQTKPQVAAESTASVPTAKPAESAPKAKPAPAKKSAETGSIRVGIDKVDNLINMVGELVITQSMLGQLGTDFDVNRLPKLLEGLSQLEQNTRELQESVMRIRMLPISFAFSRFPRMVRDLGQALGKDLQLEMLGEHTELDKTVMEKIGDPLVHLVRNAVDHGIEMPADRLAKGKPANGKITLNAYHQGGNVVIEISDDGKGLDREKIIEKAIEKNLVTPLECETFTDEQAYDLIFQPGFSTAQAVSDLSGRGVGMDVVKRNIQALNGIVEIRSTKDKGSTITIRLPLTLAILDGQLVRVGNNTYIFPLVSIIESLHCRREFINKVAGGCNVFKLRDDYVPIIELYKTFTVQPDAIDMDHSLIVVVDYEGGKVGVVVDELLAQQQVVIKSLEQNYRRVDGISGATILGDGTVALILDITGIVKLAGDKFVQTSARACMSQEGLQGLAQLAS